MNKIVYNSCYGGFSLSREAILLAREISGDPKWNGPCIVGDTYGCGTKVDNDYGFFDVDLIDRHDPVLVQVVEELGQLAGGNHASLKIYETTSKAYRIDEYDGNETVVTRDNDYEFTHIN
tara:strand:+ start:201 stop:560 length:360 start_codon:yes stop_codon:yes gene_type:complete